MLDRAKELIQEMDIENHPMVSCNRYPLHLKISSHTSNCMDFIDDVCHL